MGTRFFFWVDGHIKSGDKVSFHFDSTFFRKKVNHRRKASLVTTILETMGKRGGDQAVSA